MGKEEDEGRDCDDVACAWTEREPSPSATAGEGGICWYQDDDSDPDPDAGRRPGHGAGENEGDRRGLVACTEGSPCSRTAAGEEVQAAEELEGLGSMSSRVSAQGANAMRMGESAGGFPAAGCSAKETRRNGSASRR